MSDPERHRRAAPSGFGRQGPTESDQSTDRGATGLPSDAPTERPTIHSVSALRREDGSFLIPEGIAPPGSRHGSFYARYGKRILDLVLAGGALLVALPVLALAALAVRLTMGRPIMFHQERIGLDGRMITVLKLRTMKPDRRRSRGRGRYQGEDRRRTHKTAEHPLLTPVGRFLRKYSIDELPQIFNVLRGEMTIVGPRPELAIVVERYEPWQYARLLVRPGLTGLWQITARGDGGLMHERVDLDVEYLSCLGLRTDLNIIAKTPKAMLGDHKGV